MMKFLKNLRNIFNIAQGQLAHEISVDRNTISRYESGKVVPSMKSLIRIVDYFSLSLDYYLLQEKCLYPRNLNLLKLATLVDKAGLADIKINIKATIKTLADNKIIGDSTLKQDTLKIELRDDFQNNLKEIRKSRGYSQLELSSMLNISRSLLAQYELREFPLPDRLAKISELLDISMHALVKGESLSFNFQDKDFGQAILMADHHLSLEDHKFLIRLMEAVLKK